MPIVIVKDNVQECLEALAKAKIRGLNAIGAAAEKHAKAICPVDTGRLRNSITHTEDGENAYIGTNVEYAPYVELGTSKQKAQPYLRPAATEHDDEYKALMEASLKNA
jgi:HK97 gp10 family phage protein